MVYGPNREFENTSTYMAVDDNNVSDSERKRNRPPTVPYIEIDVNKFNEALTVNAPWAMV